MQPTVQRQLIVFDFDWSLVDQDTDRWIFEVLAPQLRRKMKSLKEEIQWTDLVASNLVELHKLGKTRAQVEDALRIIPFHPAMIRAIRKIKETSDPQTTFLILSNSNSVFINTILEHYNLTHIFAEITTNPAEWDPSGLLKLQRRVLAGDPQHNCKVGCSPNMCKGQELEAFLARQPNGFDRMIYIGDGANDFCPLLRLGSKDRALVRRFRGLERRILQEGAKEGLCCEIQYWGGAWEVEEIFDTL